MFSSIKKWRRAAHESNRKTLFRLLTVVCGLIFIFVYFPAVLLHTVAACFLRAYHAVRYGWQGTFDGTGSELVRGLVKQFRDGRFSGDT